MSVQVRRLVAEEGLPARRLGWEAFGVPGGDPSEPTVGRPGWHWWGAVDGQRVVATAADREFDGWFAGRTLPVAGIAGVTVAVEDRGRGVLGPLMVALLEQARTRGAVMSTLWPSAPGIYRRTGYEVVNVTRWIDVPSSALVGLAPTPGLTLRRAGVGDAETVRRLYDSWASGTDGALTRRGVSFPATDAQLVGAATGVTIAEDAGGVAVGYASWTRGPGSGTGPELSVVDLVATRTEAYAALLRALGSFDSVAATVQLHTTGDDLVRLLLPTTRWAVAGEDLYMLKVLDVEAAFTGARCAQGLTLRSGFTLAGDVLADLDGSYTVQAEGGRVSCVRGPAADDRTLAPRGLALLVTGARPCRDLRLLGLLTGGDPAEDADWDALVAGRVRGVLDHF